MSSLRKTGKTVKSQPNSAFTHRRDFMRDYVKTNAQGDIFGAKPVKAAKRPKG